MREKAAKGQGMLFDLSGMQLLETTEALVKFWILNILNYKSLLFFLQLRSKYFNQGEDAFIQVHKVLLVMLLPVIWEHWLHDIYVVLNLITDYLVFKSWFGGWVRWIQTYS